MSPQIIYKKDKYVNGCKTHPFEDE